ncbi:MAG: nucleotidyl transferase AbiEii/AbiGii toxin family protein [Myxococcales bacterium]|nr:MAG: nucleotidyl transferase AbiEii/AbiGii toxin family protein [Myxococcales bacterium]
MTIPPDWKEFLEALVSENTKFLLIGGHALAFHVEARLTEDLDLFIEASEQNARCVYNALRSFGFGDAVDSPDALKQPNKIFMLGRKPWRIDILTGIDGITFEEAWSGRCKVDFHGIPLNVIGREALLANKLASGRKKDLMDAALLQEASTKTEKPTP